MVLKYDGKSCKPALVQFSNAAQSALRNIIVFFVCLFYLAHTQNYRSIQVSTEQAFCRLHTVFSPQRVTITLPRTKEE